MVRSEKARTTRSFFSTLSSLGARQSHSDERSAHSARTSPGRRPSLSTRQMSATQAPTTAPEAVYKRPLEDETRQNPKQPRRVVPTPVAAAASIGGEEGSAAAQPQVSAPEPQPVDPIGDGDDSEADPEHIARLAELDEDEQQQLIDDYFTAKEEHDDALLMLVGGPETRRPGEPHSDVAPRRVEVRVASPSA